MFKKEDLKCWECGKLMSLGEFYTSSTFGCESCVEKYFKNPANAHLQIKDVKKAMEKGNLVEFLDELGKNWINKKR